MPRLQGISQSHLNGVDAKLTDARESKFKVRCKPCGIKVETRITQFGEHIVKIHFDKGGQHETIVQRCAPACDRCGVGFLPEASNQSAQ